MAYYNSTLEFGLYITNDMDDSLQYTGRCHLIFFCVNTDLHNLVIYMKSEDRTASFSGRSVGWFIHQKNWILTARKCSWLFDFLAKNTISSTWAFAFIEKESINWSYKLIIQNTGYECNTCIIFFPTWNKSLEVNFALANTEIT